MALFLGSKQVKLYNQDDRVCIKYFTIDDLNGIELDDANNCMLFDSNNCVLSFRKNLDYDVSTTEGDK